MTMAIVDPAVRVDDELTVGLMLKQPTKLEQNRGEMCTIDQLNSSR